MRDALLPLALLAAALGLSLAFAPNRARWIGLAVLCGLGAASSFVPWPSAWTGGLFVACWLSIAATAATVHLPRGVPLALAVALAANVGVWAGALGVSAGSRLDLLMAAPLALLCLPGAWMVDRGWRIALKVASSWLIAVALLALGLSMVPTPGYAPDHME